MEFLTNYTRTQEDPKGGTVKAVWFLPRTQAVKSIIHLSACALSMSIVSMRNLRPAALP